jgi:hypothetical protein
MNSRMLARVEQKGSDEKKKQTISIWEVLGGTIRLQLEIDGDASALSFSEDGRHLAASMYGAPVFLWDLYSGAKPPSPDRAGLDRAWADLAKSDGIVGFAAIKLLAAYPDRAAPFLREVLPPIAPPDHAHVARLIADLEHKEFRKRESATKSLAELGERARGALRQAANGNLAPETRERIDRLLAAEERKSPEFLRMARALEAMEAAGTPEAIKVIEYWSAGAKGANFTRSAQAAMKRLKERKAK